MSEWLLAAVAAVLVVVMYASARAVRCNFRRLRYARRTPPLDGLVLNAARVRPRPPKSWPQFDEVNDPAVAAAYASYADDLALGYAAAGEVVTVVAAAALGVMLPHITAGWSGAFVGILVVFVLIGLGLRLRGGRVWSVVAARYRERYRVLTAPRPPDEPVPPPTWRDRVLGRLRRR